MSDQHTTGGEIRQFRFQRVEPGNSVRVFGMGHERRSDTEVSSELLLQRTQKLRAAVLRIIDRTASAVNEEQGLPTLLMKSRYHCLPN